MPARPFITADQAVEYQPEANGQSDLKIDAIMGDASDYIENLHGFGDRASVLTEAITASATSIKIKDGSLMPPKGVALIEDERITYTGIVVTTESVTLTGVTRGVYNTVAAAHDAQTRISAKTVNYAERRVRCELRLFEFLWETRGMTIKESLQGVGATDYNSMRAQRRIVGEIMGKAAHARAPRII